MAIAVVGRFAFWLLYNQQQHQYVRPLSKPLSTPRPSPLYIIRPYFRYTTTSFLFLHPHIRVVEGLSWWMGMAFAVVVLLADPQVNHGPFCDCNCWSAIPFCDCCAVVCVLRLPLSDRVPVVDAAALVFTLHLEGRMPWWQRYWERTCWRCSCWYRTVEKQNKQTRRVRP